MAENGFWDRPEDARKVIGQLKIARHVVVGFDSPAKTYTDLQELYEMARDEADAATIEAVARDLGALEVRVHDFELESLLAGDNDHLGAVVTIHPGAGGTESQDWAEMLYRMYTRYCERRGWPAAVLDLQPGEEAGLKDASFEVDTEYAFGFLKAETGVHRLVRISPFDAAKRRQTSFASVHVTPLIDDTIVVDIKDDDLRIDTYRASGAGGQHVNKTESAVRITHIPTSIVAQSQAERSQHKNRESAMKMLKSRLYTHFQAIEKARQAGLTEPKKDINFGSQIRSYVLQPYTMVKDLRTSAETSDVSRVLDGDIDLFIDAFLRHKE